MLELNWEVIEGTDSHVSVHRAEVPGGWLVRFSQFHDNGGAGGLTFVPDTDHKWK